MTNEPVPSHVSLRTRTKAAAGLALLLMLLALGVLALTAPVTSEDLRLDQAIAILRFGVASAFALDLTRAAQEAVGLGVLALGLVVLLVRGRRWDATRLVLTAGGAWVLALAVKQVFDRPRPPASLWMVAPDPTGSFPSGHTTTAAVIALIVFTSLLGTGRVRMLAVGLALGYALAVGASRLYLGSHYPTDVLASYLDVAISISIVSAVTDLPRVRQLAARVLRAPELVPG